MKKLDFRFRGNDEAHKCAWALCRREPSVNVTNRDEFRLVLFKKQLKIPFEQFIDFEYRNDPICLLTDAVDKTLFLTNSIRSRSDIFFRKADRFGETVDHESGNVITVFHDDKSGLIGVFDHL